MTILFMINNSFRVGNSKIKVGHFNFKRKNPKMALVRFRRFAGHIQASQCVYREKNCNKNFYTFFIIVLKLQINLTTCSCFKFSWFGLFARKKMNQEINSKLKNLQEYEGNIFGNVIMISFVSTCSLFWHGLCHSWPLEQLLLRSE